ncbi:MAG: hypothetical protein AVDCRST_MAG67-428 [uncultured Solirubrobacteraceae bacterium]|uniref:Iminophenyl-pyruvate dimer synthase domain-containing protein n=1 Tax=uncultured Solirubrobacteraceae bacterium TaxID=1162706 RepID=A0A6J4RI98_9ACTN|nr:MAG: hypothetical protein AVDCRST_MAG67-428 [uncultured Solirubrobacteraceae bacterium]
MPAPGFRWTDYEVPADGGGETFELLATAQTGAPAPATVTIALPDLSDFPTPREKAEVLLQSAAEVEHALMVQYLYAAYSLKAARDVTDPAHKAALRETSEIAWPTVLLGIAREEMGHLMTVQNLLLLLAMAPNLEREDFPPQKDLYPFKLHLEPVSQRSLAKYVVAEAPAGAPGIEDIAALATDSAGTTINRVGTLYGLLGLIFAAPDQLGPGASGDETWDAMVRQLSVAAFEQAPAETWHLPDDAFDASSLARQADPAAWQVGDVRVHRMADRAAAVQAIRDVGEQGEGPIGAGELSHFGRFLTIFRGQTGVVPFPAPSEWTPTRDVPTDPTVGDIGDARTRRWAELADIRYALLLGFVEHYLLARAVHRDLLTAWIFAEMRSRIGYIARLLTTLPRGDATATAAVAAIPFTLPAVIHLPADEAARWDLHRERTNAAIAKVQAMQAAGDATDEVIGKYLADMLASDAARISLIEQLPATAPIPTSFARDIQPLFRPKDIDHMDNLGVILDVYEKVDERRDAILERLAAPDDLDVMPKPPDPRWTEPQLELFRRWIAENRPR